MDSVLMYSRYINPIHRWIVLQIIAVFLTTCGDYIINVNASILHCPTPLTKFNCSCTIMPSNSTQILCHDADIGVILDGLRGYNQTIDKLGIRNCKQRLNSLGPLPVLRVSSKRSKLVPFSMTY